MRGYCETHKRVKGQREFEICQGHGIAPAVRQHYLVGWTGKPAPSPSRAPESGARLSSRDTVRESQWLGTVPCVHRGEVPLRFDESNLCGTRGQLTAVYACALHGECSLWKYCQRQTAHVCGRCKDRKEPAPPVLSSAGVARVDLSNSVRHFMCHIWPVKGFGGWQWNCDKILSNADLFNGRRIVAIATSDEADDPDQVREYLRGFTDEFIVMPNSAKLREVVTFLPMLEKLEAYRSSHDVTFSCHAKGAHHKITPEAEGSTIFLWTDAMYETCLDWPSVRPLLEAHGMVGNFKRYMPGKSGAWGRWHYSGTFYWFRNQEVFVRNWRNVPQFFAGTEAWPCRIFTARETACLVGDAIHNLYDVRYWRDEIEPRLELWRQQKKGSVTV